MKYLFYLCSNQLKIYTMTLFVSHETFLEMLTGLVKAGTKFDAKEFNGGIHITFTGGY